jgi:hypothetical protein|tara:strand:+ start:1260 stop:1412 length:153 start_codon:yes stop_codon:yes gene_type:complete
MKKLLAVLLVASLTSCSLLKINRTMKQFNTSGESKHPGDHGAPFDEKGIK